MIACTERNKNRMKHNEDVKSLTIKDTPFGYTLSLISGKWKMPILYLLSKKNIVRFNEMSRMLGSITYKTLSTPLKELEADELIIRKEYPQIPPKVEYSLSEKGKSLIPILDAMCNWGVKNQTYK